MTSRLVTLALLPTENEVAYVGFFVSVSAVSFGGGVGYNFSGDDGRRRKKTFSRSWLVGGDEIIAGKKYAEKGHQFIVSRKYFIHRAHQHSRRGSMIYAGSIRCRL